MRPGNAYRYSLGLDLPPISTGIDIGVPIEIEQNLQVVE
jgi:hypothetical protein